MLTNIFIISAVIFIIFNILFVLSACKVAGRDEWEEQLISDIKETSYIR